MSLNKPDLAKPVAKRTRRRNQPVTVETVGTPTNLGALVGLLRKLAARPSLEAGIDGKAAASEVVDP